MKQICVWLPETHIAELDQLVKGKMYPSRNEAIRFAIHDFLIKEKQIRRHQNTE